MPTAGSASGVLPNPVGYNRVYTNLEGEPTYKNWLHALKAGNSFVTSGPMLSITASGKNMGETLELVKPADVEIEVNLKSSRPINKVELVKDGKVIQQIFDIDLKNYNTDLIFQSTFQRSGWLAVRCFEEREDDNTRFAHTSPVFVMVAGKPIQPKRDAVEWLMSRVDLLTERVLRKLEEAPEDRSHWDSKVHLYQQAKAVYMKLLDQSI
jgi:hypothetical protein